MGQRRSKRLNYGWVVIRRSRIAAAATAALPVQPTQLYSSFTAFLLAALLIAYLGLPHADGRVFR